MNARRPGNQLLDRLPAEDYQRLLPELDLVHLPLEYPVFEPNVPMKSVYLPVDCIISLLCIMEDGGSGEIAVVGNEGVVGLSLFMGVIRHPVAPSSSQRAPPIGCPASGPGRSSTGEVRCSSCFLTTIRPC